MQVQDGFIRTIITNNISRIPNECGSSNKKDVTEEEVSQYMSLMVSTEVESEAGRFVASSDPNKQQSETMQKMYSAKGQIKVYYIPQYLQSAVLTRQSITEQLYS